MLKTILFRIPKELSRNLHIELNFQGVSGQDFVTKMIWDKLKAIHTTTSYTTEENYKGETRQDIELKLFSNKRAVTKKVSRRNLNPPA